MTSPIRNNVALKYLESINDSPFTSPTRQPLSPTQRYNSKPSQDLDKLALQLNVGDDVTPSKTALLRTRFETPSVTVSSFKTPSSSSASRSGSPVKRNNKYSFETPTTKKGKIPSLKPDDLSHKPYLSSPGNSTSTESPGYEYLCRIFAIKIWLQAVLDEEIDSSPAELITEVRNGILLAKLSNVILPTKKNVFTNPKLQFRHTENINRFFKLLDFLSVPDLFRFELTDLYDAKNVPKVWVCLHAISYMLNKSNSSYPAISSLIGQAEFSPEDIRVANRALITTGLPSFDSTDPNDGNAGESSYMNRTLGASPTKLESLSKSRLGDDPFRESLKTPARPQKQEVHTPSPQIIKRPAYLDDTNYKDSKYYTPELESHMTNILKLQALSRGASFRYRMFVDRIMLKSYNEEMTDLVSIIRGNMSRMKTVHRHRKEVLIYKYDVIDLQAVIRGKLLRNKHTYDFSKATNSIIGLQSAIRAQNVKHNTELLKYRLAKHSGTVSELQSKIKMLLIHSKAKIVIDNKDQIEDSVLEFQSIVRSVLYRRNKVNSMISGLKNSGGLISLQALIRGNRLRDECGQKLAALARTKSSVRQLQGIIRGGVARTRLCNNVLITLMHEDITLNDVYAKVRGNNLRNAFYYTKDQLAQEEASVIKIQTLFRGVLSRFKRDVLLEDAYDNILPIIDLQAIIRGKKIRNNLNSIDSYYYKNLDKVIKAQSVIKSNFAQRAYKSLLGMKNPPLSVVKRFAYLLSDNDRDYEQEIELSELKDKIIEKSKANEELDTLIENLDIKLSLLDRNKISVDDFMKNKFKRKASKDAGENATNLKRFEKLNKSSRERIEAYQSLLYLVQTNPEYWIKLYENMNVVEKDTVEYQTLQAHLLLLFPVKDSSVTHHSREEFFFMKLIKSLMKMDMDVNCRTSPDITKSNFCFWIDFLNHFNSHTFQRMHLKNLFGQIVSSLIDDDEADFESDPSMIHNNLIERDIKVNGYSDREKDLSPQVAIKDPETADKFVVNLMQLREYSTLLLNTIENSVIRFPLHIKIIAKEGYTLSKASFPEKPEKQHLAVAGVILIKHYIGHMLNYPENFGLSVVDPFDITGENKRVKNNLKYLSRVMVQMFALKPFSDNFLKPLNEYVSSSMDTCINIVQRVIDVGTLESEYKLTVYDDIVARERPKLNIRVNDMIQIEKLIQRNLDVVAPSSDDQIYTLSTSLYNSVNFADDLAALSELGVITLTLNPTTKEESIADTKGNALMTQAKRSILYVMRVQEGNDLLELLASGIKPVHEKAFKEITSNEKKQEEFNKDQKKKAYHNTPLGDLSSMTFHELKKSALESFLKLEQLGLITRTDSFQEVLNQIVVDIKTKHQQRVMRQSQYDVAVRTHQKLLEKESFLEKQHQDYKNHIETVLSQLQSKPKDKKLFNIIPIFSKQYFYQRELRKSNRLPKFGSYKLSAKKLMDMKVLHDFGGALNERHGSSSKLDFMFSCHKAGTFIIEAANGSVSIPGAYSSISLDELLDLQYENKEKFEVFDGMVIFDTTNFVSFLLTKFYDIKKE